MVIVISVSSSIAPAGISILAAPSSVTIVPPSVAETVVVAEVICCFSPLFSGSFSFLLPPHAVIARIKTMEIEIRNFFIFSSIKKITQNYIEKLF